jgi:hypothetical protein
MELWLVGKSLSLSLLFQAKKLIKPYDGYVNKLRYPHDSRRQLRRLLNYAKKTGRYAGYAFYAVSDHTGSPSCGCAGATDGGVYIIGAYTIVDFANGRRGIRVAKGALLNASIPFHCWFCCLSSALAEVLNDDLSPDVPKLNGFRPTADLPGYAARLLALSGGSMQEAKGLPLDFEKPRAMRRVGAYDLRSEKKSDFD